MSYFFLIRLTTYTTRVVKWFSYSRFHMCPPGTWFLNGRQRKWLEKGGHRSLSFLKKQMVSLLYDRKELLFLLPKMNFFVSPRQNRKPLSWHEPLNRFFFVDYHFYLNDDDILVLLHNNIEY